jgi:cell division protein FtsB
MAVPISNVVRRIVFAPSGTGPYAFTFEILAATDIEVYKGDTLLTLTTDYTVTINPNGTGSVTLVATAGTDNITIVGARTIQRTTDFVTGGDLFANSLNEELDSLTIFTQQNAEAGDRSIRAPVTDPTTIDMTLPTKTARAGKYLSFNASTGNPEVVNTVLDITAVANNTANINTVAGQISPVNNISTVAGAATNIATVAGIAANVTTVAGISGNVTTVAGISANVTSVAGNATNINTVAGLSTEIAALGPIAADITTVAGIDSDVTAVAADATDIGTVASNIANVNTVAGISSNVTTVAGISADVTAVAGDATDIGAVAGIAANVTTVAGIAANVTTVANISADVTTVATNVADITNFSDVYLGPAATDPATRNDSSALQAGDLYFNTVDDAIKVYTGSAWVTAYITADGFVTVADAQTITGVKTFDNGLATDTISEETSAAGVTVDGVLLKDSQVTTDQINEKTSAAGVTIDGVLLKDSQVTTDQINEKTSAAGVTIDGVLLKDSGVVTGAGTVSAPVYSTTGDTNTGIFFPAADTIAFAEGGAEAMRIDSNSNVQIATTSNSLLWFNAITTGNRFRIEQNGAPAANAYVTQGLVRNSNDAESALLGFAKSCGTTAGSATIVNNNDNLGVITFQGADGTNYIEGARITAIVNGTPGADDMPGALLFSTTADGASTVTERARITSGGYFKASNNGTYLSTGTYHEIRQTENEIALVIEGTNASLTAESVAFIRAERNTTNNTFYALSYFNGGASAYKFRVADSGNVTNTNNSYGSISDVKLKQDIVDAGSQWDDIKNLRVRKYRWKSDPNGFMQMGLVAQETEEVSPGLIDEHPDYEEVEVPVLDDDGNPVLNEDGTPQVTKQRNDLGTTTKSVKYSVLYMKAVKALQEAMDRIETLEAKNDALEARIAALEQA